MKSKTALVGTQGLIELNSPASVELELVVVVEPGDTEGDDSLWLAKDFEDFEEGRI